MGVRYAPEPTGIALGMRATGRKVVYCHTPARWLYGQAGTYLADWPAPIAAGVRVAGPALRRWDKRAAASADPYLANSSEVRGRIAAAYGVEADVVPPQVAIDVTIPRPRLARSTLDSCCASPVSSATRTSMPSWRPSSSWLDDGFAWFVTSRDSNLGSVGTSGGRHGLSR